MVTLAIWRIERLRNFFKQFILVDDLSDSVEDSFKQGILEYGAGLELLQREINKSERYNFPVSIILLEIKKSTSQSSNDFFEALQATVKRSIRETDIFGFWKPDLDNKPDNKLDSNSEHFICILPHTKFKEAYDLSERFRLKLSRRFSLNDDVDIRLADLDTTDLDVQEFASLKDSPESSLENNTNISCGITELEYYEGLELLIERATTALDLARTKGGNCTMPQPVIEEVAVTDIAKHLN